MNNNSKMRLYYRFEDDIYNAVVGGDLEGFLNLCEDYERTTGDKCNIDIDRLFIVASHYGHLNLVEYFIQQGANIDAEDEYQRSALSWASYADRTDVARYLIEKGADVETFENGGKTPLIYTSMNGNLDLVMLLINAGADVDSSDYRDTTPLMYASREGHLDIVRYLIQQDASVDSVNVRGYRPINLAFIGGHMDIVIELLRNGARTDNLSRNELTTLRDILDTTDINVRIKKNISSKLLNGRYGHISKKAKNQSVRNVYNHMTGQNVGPGPINTIRKYMGIQPPIGSGGRRKTRKRKST